MCRSKYRESDGCASDSSRVWPDGIIRPQVQVVIHDAEVLQIPAIKFHSVPVVEPGPLCPGQKILVEEVVELPDIRGSLVPPSRVSRAFGLSISQVTISALAFSMLALHMHKHARARAHIQTHHFPKVHQVA